MERIHLHRLDKKEGKIMGKIDENKKQKKDTLLKVAFDLFTDQGITKTSISDIVQQAGVAKGTFYLYFKDKYDLKNKLISHKASQIFSHAITALQEEKGLHQKEFEENKELFQLEENIIFIIDNIIDQLTKNKTLLKFISKNLSWGVFKHALTSSLSNKFDINFIDVYHQLIEDSGNKISNPEIMLYLIVEFVGSSCHDAILYQEPAPIQEVKPYILQSVRNIIQSHIIK